MFPIPLFPMQKLLLCNVIYFYGPLITLQPRTRYYVYLVVVHPSSFVLSVLSYHWLREMIYFEVFIDIMIVPEFAKIIQQFRKMKGNCIPREHNKLLRTERPCDWNSVNQELRVEEFFSENFCSVTSSTLNSVSCNFVVMATTFLFLCLFVPHLGIKIT
jgi:hypothetical protein